MLRVEPALLYPLAFLLPLAAVVALTPVAVRVARRFGVMDRPGETKHHRVETPYLGGLALAVVLAVAAGITAGAERQLLVILVSGLILSLVGLADDQRFVRPWTKVAVEVLAAVALWTVGVRGGLFGSAPLDLALTILWVVGITNVVNMLDNMDGLAAGVAAISALTFAVIAGSRGDYLVTAMALAVAGGCAGFLPYNFPPAKVFLGDAGTLMIGFLLAALGLKLDLLGENGFIRSAVPVLAVGVPLFDAILVIIDRWRGGRPIYRGATDHSSHRLAALGVSARGIALGMYGFQIAASVMAVWILDASFPLALGFVIVSGTIALALMIVLLRMPHRQPDRSVLIPSEHPSPR
ncbi:MAG: glycosyltransferase family 4 protein [Actinomycetota bacterium]